MTQKDIRDIAAYWGAPITYTIEAGNDPWEEDRTDGSTRYGNEEFEGIVSIAAMDGIYLWWTAKRVTNVKLHLRHIQSLTDKELGVLVNYLCPNKTIKTTNRPLNLTGVENRFLLYLNDGSKLAITTEAPLSIVWYTRSGSPKIAAGIAYLQSIGVYVPDTIDPQYVELVP